MTTIEKLLADRPTFHRSETEIDRAFEPNESRLASRIAEQFAAGGATCYAVAPEVLQFLADSVSASSKTLETGAGLSTLIFAVRTAQHIAVTPSESEIISIRNYAVDNSISLGSVSFICEPSEKYLPRCQLADLDLILLDGKHAFPWPMVDWFYTADRLKQGGLMIIDDAQMRSVGVLRDFMAADPAWNVVRDFAGKTVVFQKTRPCVHDVAWHMQPWNIDTGSISLRPQVASRLVRKAKRLLFGD